MSVSKSVIREDQIYNEFRVSLEALSKNEMHFTAKELALYCGRKW